MIHTRTILVQELQAKPASPQRDGLIRKARSGHYHPDTSTLGAPKAQLIHDLTAARMPDLAARAREGVYGD